MHMCNNPTFDNSGWSNGSMGNCYRRRGKSFKPPCVNNVIYSKASNYIGSLRDFIQAAWNYYENNYNTSESFSKEEQESWNAQKKSAAEKKSDQQ